MIWAIFEKIARDQYDEVTEDWARRGMNFPYSVDDVLEVFAYFFSAYASFANQEHPPLRKEQIRKIIEQMPFTDIHHGAIADIDHDSYPVMIDSYFATPFRNCDYRINHFFSGQIREMRYYEELY